MPSRTKTAADYRRAELARIHVAKKELCLDDDTYRDILWAVCRVKSSADLDSQGRFKLLKHFKSLGWKPSTKKRAAGDAKDRKIWSLWYQLKEAGLIAHATAPALRSEVLKITGRSDLKFCDQAQKSHLIECLKKWLERGA